MGNCDDKYGGDEDSGREGDVDGEECGDGKAYGTGGGSNSNGDEGDGGSDGVIMMVMMVMETLMMRVVVTEMGTMVVMMVVDG